MPPKLRFVTKLGSIEIDYFMRLPSCCHYFGCVSLLRFIEFSFIDSRMAAANADAGYRAEPAQIRADAAVRLLRTTAALAGASDAWWASASGRVTPLQVRHVVFDVYCPARCIKKALNASVTRRFRALRTQRCTRRPAGCRRSRANTPPCSR